jgi:hypothetical protein
MASQSPDRPNPQLVAVQQRIIEALKAKGALRNCPTCGHISWMIGSYVALPVTRNADRPPTLGGPTYPLVAVICRVCGNTQLVNLFVLGFTKADLDPLELPEGFSG